MIFTVSLTTYQSTELFRRIGREFGGSVDFATTRIVVASEKGSDQYHQNILPPDQQAKQTTQNIRNKRQQKHGYCKEHQKKRQENDSSIHNCKRKRLNPVPTTCATTAQGAKKKAADLNGVHYKPAAYIVV